MGEGQKVAMVTGGNKGIGLSLVRRLCQLPFPGPVYLTSRDVARGRAAVEQLKAEGLNPSYHQLDLSSSESVQRFVQFVKVTHGGLDVVIANGGMAFTPQMTPAQAREAIRTNNVGNSELCLSLLPLLRRDGRLVIVSSGFGQLHHLAPPLRLRFLDTGSLSLQQLNALLEEYVTAVEDGSAEAKGWPDWCNKVSKIGLVALARILASQTQRYPRRAGVLVNAACPGWTVTDTALPFLDADLKFGEVKAKQPDEAAEDVVWLAMLPPGTTTPSGQLVQYRQVIPYEE